MIRRYRQHTTSVPPPLPSYSSPIPTACLWKRPPNPIMRTFLGVGLNLADVARAVNLDHGFISRVMSGKRNISYRQARRVAAALKMDVVALLDELDRRRTAYQAKKPA